MKEPAVKFVYSTVSDLRELLQLLKEREWYAESGVKAHIPRDAETGKAHIMKMQHQTLQRMHDLEDNWRHIERRYFDIVAKLRHSKLRKQYRVQLTVFGCEGQYRPMNTIIVRLRTQGDEKTACETIGHELLHLAFHAFFQRKKLNYEYREGMIDAIILKSRLRTLFPHYIRQPMGKVRPRLLVEIIKGQKE